MSSLDAPAPPAAAAALPRRDADLADPFAFPPPAASPAREPRVPFAPTPLRSRADGWTPARQHEFIETLADTGSVTRAAFVVGMTRESAYRLRRRPDAKGFREAWNAAQDLATERLADACLERAIHGEQVPIVHKGEIIGHRTRHSDALAIFLLKTRDPWFHGGLWLPSRKERERMDLWQLNPVPAALRQLPKLLARLLRPRSAGDAGAGPGAAASAAVCPGAEDHETP